jgi:hypothetical protein
MKEKFCPTCEVEMEFHPISHDFMFTRLELENHEDFFSGILDEFYSCPKCGRTAEPDIKQTKSLLDVTMPPVKLNALTMSYSG